MVAVAHAIALVTCLPLILFVRVFLSLNLPFVFFPCHCSFTRSSLPASELKFRQRRHHDALGSRVDWVLLNRVFCRVNMENIVCPLSVSPADFHGHCGSDRAILNEDELQLGNRIRRVVDRGGVESQGVRQST